MIECYLLKNTDIYLYYECPLGVNKKQENIKNAQQAAGSLPDYLNFGDNDDDKSETE